MKLFHFELKKLSGRKSMITNKQLPRKVDIKMASVVFIIRVPYEKAITKDSKAEDINETLKESEEEDVIGSAADPNVKEVKFENDEKTDKTPNQDEAKDGYETNEANQTADDIEIFTGPLNLAEVLENELRSLNVQGDSWTITNDKQFHQVVFLEKTGESVEKILGRLTFVGIGKRLKSSVSIIPTSIHIQPQENKNITGKRNSTIQSTYTSDSTETAPLIDNNETNSKRDKFKKSIKARLTVEQVVESVRAQSLLTFDFVMFTILASLIAGVGLAEDNAVVLVASMLVSPLMGPILCGIFGTVIKNKKLRNTGLKTELYGIGVSVFVGFLFGFICGPFGASWDSKKGLWPTNEMTSRGMTRGLCVGIGIALPSGAGVALSVLGGNAGSLVGVAISASLLPPAVNSGMLWAYSIITAIKSPELEDNEFNISTSKCPVFKDNSYMPTYSCDMGKEAAIMAVISLVLTFINIVCILITATIVLKIKEVSPKASSSNATQEFWTKDIKVAREAYETIKGGAAENLLKEWKKVQGSSKKVARDSLFEGVQLLNMVEEVEETDEFESVVRRAPRGAQYLHKFSRDLKRHMSQDGAVEDNTALENQLRNLQTYYTTQHLREKQHQPHVSTIFPDQETIPEPKKNVREFHVVETERPHHTSVVRVQAPTEESNTYSVKTESGV